MAEHSSNPPDRRNKDSHSDHFHSPANENKSKLWFLLFLFGNYMLAEIIGAYFSGSLTLLADAGHMAIDTSSIALGLFAIWIASRPPTLQKTFGYFRAEILAALANGIALIGVSVFIFLKAWPRFFNPTEVKGELMTAIAIGGLLVNLVGLWLMHSGAKHSLNIKGVWLHILADTLGSVSAVTAALLIWKFGWHLADPILSVVLSIFIVIGAIRLLLDCVNVLLEGTPKHVNMEKLQADMKSVKGVTEVHDLHVWLLTSGLVSLSAHVDVDKEIDHGQVLRELTALLDNKHNISHVTIQLEPPDFSHREVGI